jgi:L-ascorbate metabolism protein UlaG (beta-lactamase superfamily)
MKQTCHGHSAFSIEVREAMILLDPLLSDNPSRHNRWNGCLTGKNSTQRGDR